MNKKARLNYIHALSTQVEHKKMYKAKKQWVVAGISFLVATGMGAIGSHLTTHADTTQANAQATLPINKGSQSKQIGSAASNLHDKLVGNATSQTNQKPQVSGSNTQTPSAKASATPVSSKVSGSQVSSSNAKSSVTYNVATSGSSKGNHTLTATEHSFGNKDNLNQESVQSSELLSKNKPLMLNSINHNITGKWGTAAYSFDKNTGSFIASGNSIASDSSYHGALKDDLGLDPTAIKSVELNNVTFPKNSSGLLKNLPNLTKVTLNNVNTENVTNMLGLFESDTSLPSLTLPKSFNTANVSDMGWMFYGDKSLHDLDVASDFKTNKVTTDTSIFSDDPKINVFDGLIYEYNPSNNSVEFTGGKFNYNLVNFIKNAPKVIQNASSIKFDTNIDSSKVTTIANMFNGDKNLEHLDLSGLDTHKVSDMSAMFDNDYALTSINFGNNFDTSNVKHMRSMFESDSSLTSLSLPSSFNTADVSDMGWLFCNDSSLNQIKFPNSFNTSNVTNMQSTFYGDTALQNLDLRQFDTSKVNDMSFMFGDDTNLQNITFGNHFDTSSVSSMSNMFMNDINLQSLDLHAFNTQNVVNMSNMFNGAHKITSLDLRSFNTSKAQYMDGMFDNDYALTSINFGSNFNTSSVKHMRSMFESDSSLTSLSLPDSFNTANVSDMGWLFCNDYALAQLSLPSSFDTRNANEEAMFYNNSLQLLNIQSPNTVIKSNSYAPTMYKELSKDKYQQVPVDLSKGNNVGTFVDIQYVHPANPQTNPNQYLANLHGYVLNPEWNQFYHFNNPQGKNNDIESIIPHYNNGKVDYWDIYYLWNPDPTNTGKFAYDEWGVTRTKDFSTFYPVDQSNPVSLNNVAIPDPAYEIGGHNRVEVAPSDTENIPWAQAAGGSIISNKKADGKSWLTKDTFGNSISSDARLAYFANYHSNNYGDYLAYANPIYSNGQIVGYHQFRPYSENNVFSGDTVGLGLTGDFRDPYVTTNPNNANQLVAYCAGGSNKGVYVLTSNDAINWKKSGFVDLSHVTNKNIETPYVANLNGQPIMFFSAQGTNEDIGYTTGHFDGNGIFQADNKSGLVDLGPDDYAGNFTKLDNNHLVFIGWLNNWKYFNGSHAGGFTLPRIISWNGNSINVTPIEPGQPKDTDEVKGTNNKYYPNGKVTVDFQPTSNFDINLVRDHNTIDKKNGVDFKFNNGQLTVTRSNSNNSVSDITTKANLSDNKLSSIQFYLDNDSIEAYLPETHQMYSILDFDDAQRNDPYTLSVMPSNAKVTSYQFDTSKPAQVANILNAENDINNISAKESQNEDIIGKNTTAQASNNKSQLDNDKKAALSDISAGYNNVNNPDINKITNDENKVQKDLTSLNNDVATDYVHFENSSDSNVVEGSTIQVSGANGAQYTVNSNQLPNNYKFASKNDAKFTLNNGNHVVYVVPSQTDNGDKDIPLKSNTVTFKGMIDLHFYNGNNTIKDIYLPYNITTANNQNIKDLLNGTNPSATIPSNYINKLISLYSTNATDGNATQQSPFNTANFSYDGKLDGYNNQNGNDSKYDNVIVDPNASGYVTGKNNNDTFNNSMITLGFTSNTVPENVHYEFNGQNEGNTTFNGPNDTTGSDVAYSQPDKDGRMAQGLNPNYHIDPNDKDTSWIYGNESNNHSDTISVLPNSAKETIDYIYNGNNYGTKVLPNGKYNQTSDVTSETGGIDHGYHLVNTKTPFTYNNGITNVDVAPNTIKGTATIHLIYKETNGTVDSTKDVQVPINSYVGGKQVVSPWTYSKDNYTQTNSDWSIPLDASIASLGNNSKYTPSKTFTYVATTAPQLVIRYVDIDSNAKAVNGEQSDGQGRPIIHDEIIPSSKLQDKNNNIKWIVGNKVTFGKQDSTNPNTINIIQAPKGFHLASDANDFDYQNGIETIILNGQTTENNKPITINGQQITKPVVLMSFGLSKAAQPAKSGSTQSNSASNSASARPSSASSSTSSSSDVINNYYHYSDNDSQALTSLANEIAQGNNNIADLASAENSKSSNINAPSSQVSCSCASAFSTLITSGMNTLINDINDEFKVNKISRPTVKASATKQHVVHNNVIRTHKHIRWIMLMKPVALHTTATSVNSGHNIAKVLKPHHKITLDVKAAFKVHHHYVFKVSYHHHDYFITTNYEYIHNSYLAKNSNVIGKQVQVLHDVYEYKNITRHHVNILHRGSIARIKQIVRLGHYNMTRIQLTNGLWVSANKNYIKLI